MSSLVIKQLPLLELLTKVNKNSRAKILKYHDLKLIEAIVECIFNVLRNNVQLERKHVKKLQRHKKILRELASPKHKLEKKQNILVQSGGSFLPIILSPIVSYLFDKIIS